jgi:hypothetical protein
MLQKGWRITFSMGAVTFLAPPVSLREMIAGADQVMLSVKNSGKTGYSRKSEAPPAEMPLQRRPQFVWALQMLVFSNETANGLRIEPINL